MSKKKRVCQTVSWKCDNQQCNGACSTDEFCNVGSARIKAVVRNSIYSSNLLSIYWIIYTVN